MLFSLIVYAPGTILFVMARREQRRTVFSSRELVIFVASVIGGVVGVVALAAGWIAV
jgi:arginine:ornithine antiporter/lysine permease